MRENRRGASSGGTTHWGGACPPAQAQRRHVLYPDFARRRHQQLPGTILSVVKGHLEGAQNPEVLDCTCCEDGSEKIGQLLFWTAPAVRMKVPCCWSPAGARLSVALRFAACDEWFTMSMPASMYRSSCSSSLRCPAAHVT